MVRGRAWHVACASTSLLCSRGSSLGTRRGGPQSCCIQHGHSSPGRSQQIAPYCSRKMVLGVRRAWVGVGPTALLKEQARSWRTQPQALWMARSSPGNKHGTDRHRPSTASSPCSNVWHPQPPQPDLQTGSHRHLNRVPELGSLTSHCCPTCTGTIPSFSPLVLLCLCFQIPGFFHQSSSCL